AALVSLAFDPPAVAGGAVANGLVTLSGPAPAAGTRMTLSSRNPAVVTVPANFWMAPGGPETRIPVTTHTVATATPVTVSVSYGGVTREATLTVLPQGPVSVSFAPNRMGGGESAIGTVTLSQPAPAGGAVVALASMRPAIAAAPASVTVAAGQTTATFSVTTDAVAAMDD